MTISNRLAMPLPPKVDQTIAEYSLSQATWLSYFEFVHLHFGKMINCILLMLAALKVSTFAFAVTAGSKALKVSENTSAFQPNEGMVPDAATAISIAVAVWNPIYGEKKIPSEMPYNATLKSGLWTVTGSVPGGWVVV